MRRASSGRFDPSTMGPGADTARILDDSQSTAPMPDPSSSVGSRESTELRREPRPYRGEVMLGAFWSQKRDAARPGAVGPCPEPRSDPGSRGVFPLVPAGLREWTLRGRAPGRGHGDGEERGDL